MGRKERSDHGRAGDRLCPPEHPVPEHPVDVAEVLGSGSMTVHGRIPAAPTRPCWSCPRSGTSHPGRLQARPRGTPAVGLPQRPLPARGGRVQLSEILGWGLVPLTVLRSSGPHGPGSVQRFVPEDGSEHYFTLRDDQRWWPTLRKLAAFDVVANNADRKSGHVLLAEDRLWAIDNGLCFHERAQAAHRGLGFRCRGTRDRRSG